MKRPATLAIVAVLVAALGATWLATEPQADPALRRVCRVDLPGLGLPGGSEHH